MYLTGLCVCACVPVAAAVQADWVGTPDLDAIVEADGWARRWVKEQVGCGVVWGAACSCVYRVNVHICVPGASCREAADVLLKSQHNVTSCLRCRLLAVRSRARSSPWLKLQLTLPCCCAILRHRMSTGRMNRDSCSQCTHAAHRPA
jgi:hypothetical protein